MASRAALSIAALAGFTAAILLPASAIADSRSKPPWKPLGAMTCADFLHTEDAVKPELVYWAAIADKNGRPDPASIDVDDSDRMVPLLVEQCRDARAASFWPKVKAEARKLEKKSRL